MMLGKIRAWRWAVLAVIASIMSVVSAKAGARPNLVLIYADDLGFGDMAAYGRLFGTASKIPTPNMDRLATEGLLFTQAHSCSGVCTPSRYGILTGRYSWRLKSDGVLPSGIVGSYGNPIIRQGEVTIAQFLRDRGYRTAAFGKWHLGAQFYDHAGVPFTGNSTAISSADAIDLHHRIEGHAVDHGFDSFRGVVETINRPPYAYMRDDTVLFDGGVPLPGTYPWEWLTTGLASESPDGVGDPNIHQIDFSPTMIAAAVDFIESRATNSEPFFAYVSLYSPHAPHLPTPDFQGSVGYTYGDFVHETDYWIGQVIAAVDALPQPTNTIVVLTADNGPETHAYTASRAFGHDSNGPLRGVKRDSWEGGTRVPFVIRWPGHIASNTVTDELVWQGDIYATLSDVLGVPLPDGAAPDAESFLPILRGDAMATNRRDAIVIASIDNQLSLCTVDGWKLVDGTGGGGNSTSYDADNVNIPNAHGTIGGTPRQLFRLADDIGERTNLIAVLPSTETQLLARLDAYRLAPDVPTTLAAHWAFDETAGTVAADTVGGADGTLGSGVTPGQAGRIGRACALDGTTNGVVTAIGYKGIAGTTARTVSLWVKTANANTGKGLISWGVNANGKAWDFVMDAGRGRLNISGGNTIGSTTVNDEAWHLLAAAFSDSDGSPNANDVALYVDGIRETPASVTAYALSTASGLDVAVGLDRSRQSAFSGSIDDAAVWQGALAPAQVRALYELADEPGLNYDAAAAQQLFGAYTNGVGGHVTIGALEWSYTTGLTASVDGDLIAADGDYALVMDSAAGTGLSTAEALPPPCEPTIVHVAWDQTSRDDTGSAFFAGTALASSDIVCRERVNDFETSLQGVAFFKLCTDRLTPDEVNAATFRATLTMTYAAQLNGVQGNNMLPALARVPEACTWDNSPGAYPLATWVATTNLGDGLLLGVEHALVYNVLAAIPPVAIRCDVTDDVRAWVNGTATNNGYVLFATTDINQGAGFSDLALNCERAPIMRDHWPFDEPADAPTAINRAGGTAGTPGSGVTRNQPGALGRAYAFDGTSNAVVTMAGDTGVFGNGPRTVSVWVAPVSRGGLVSWGRDTAANAWEVEIDDDDGPGAFRCNISSAFSRDTNDLRGTGWHHVAATFTHGTHANSLIYSDGTPVAAIYGGTAMNAPVQTVPYLELAIGVERMRLEYFEGLIDDVAIWSSALTAGELHALHELGTAADLRYDASQVQTLFEAYAAGPGHSVTIGDRTWEYATGLAAAGDGRLVVTGSGPLYALVLDAAHGTGLHVSAPPGSVLLVR